MGSVYVTFVADVLRSVGLQVTEVPGHETRSRSSGGYDIGPVGICWHHTASSPLRDGWPEVNYMTFLSDARPICNSYIDRTGMWWVCADGATNTEGRGGPYHDIPLDMANRVTYGIEVGNNGIGEEYPEVQQDSLLLGTAVLWNRFAEMGGYNDDGLSALWRLYSHFEWAPTRKIDPSGPARWSYYQNHKWDMVECRRDLIVKAAGLLGPWPPEPEPDPDPDPPLMEVISPCLYYVVSGDSPWSVSTKVYGLGGKYPILMQANPGTWHPGDRIAVPGTSGPQTIVQSGEGPYAVLRRMFQGENPSTWRLSQFYKWNGGQGRILRPGDVVCVPG